MTESNPDTQFHLIGHSFGCKLILAGTARPGLTLPRPVQSLTLLQGALSAYAFAARVPGLDAAGGYHSILQGGRIAGPIVATFTDEDWPLTWAYPLGSRLSHDIGDLQRAKDVSPYAALGAAGIVGDSAPGVVESLQQMASVGQRYSFESGHCYNVRATAIHGHSDLDHDEVGWLIWNEVHRTPNVDRRADLGTTRPGTEVRAAKPPDRRSQDIPDAAVSSPRNSVTVKRGVPKPKSSHLMTFVVWYDPMSGPALDARELTSTINDLAGSYRRQQHDSQLTIEAPVQIPVQGPFSNQITRTSLLNLIDHAAPRISDETTVLFTFVGHGDVDTQHQDERRLILDGDDTIFRSEIIERLQKTNARLIVFLTESCAGEAVTAPPPKKVTFGEDKTRAIVFERLFITPSGIVDIASSTFERDRLTRTITAAELSWCPPSGGMFGLGLVDALKRPPAEVVHASSDNWWPEVFCAARKNTIARYAAFRSSYVVHSTTEESISEKLKTAISAADAGALLQQRTQRPQAFNLAGRKAACDERVSQ